MRGREEALNIAELRRRWREYGQDYIHLARRALLVEVLRGGHRTTGRKQQGKFANCHIA